MKRQRIGKFFGLFWRQLLYYMAIVLAIVTALWWHLATLVPNFSLPEQVARANANSMHKILDNPLYMPHKLIQYAFIRLGHSDLFWMRSASAICAVVILLIFFDIIRNWYSRRIALMAGAMLLTSAWFLHFARLGTPWILFAFSIGLLWVGTKLRSANAPRIRTILTSTLIIGVCLYVPGLAWIIVPMLVWRRKLVWHELRSLPTWLSVLVPVSVVVGLVPLAYGLLRHPVLVIDWLMLPRQVTLGQAWSHAWHIPVWLALRGPQVPVYWLGRSPMFDIFSLTMMLLGIFVLSHYYLLDRVKAIIVICLLAIVLTIMNGWLALILMLPILFVIIAAGLALFLQQWFTVFPHNPLARTVGVLAVTMLVVLACYYNVRHYFVAWPHNTETRQVFDLQA